jgi:GNAT superfamily N-acetyltransferase
MYSSIQIVEKPDWVSWDEIKQCLEDAHSINRDKGINMSHYHWPTEKIIDFLGKKGVMLVALDERKVIGTAAIADKAGNAWYAKGNYAYMCFAGVLPQYQGQGIYRNLLRKREEIAKNLGYKVFMMDTNAKNKVIQKNAIKNGYRIVRYFLTRDKDHFSVILVKWTEGFPFSKYYSWMKYRKSKIRAVVSKMVSR